MKFCSVGWGPPHLSWLASYTMTMSEWSERIDGCRREQERLHLWGRSRVSRASVEGESKRGELSRVSQVSTPPS
ncbi:hypothetical protein RHGRI_006125 [Rhododendron griersonianum]|uniref:Uncharacterized protein n=1 Tax=Rhododendron griersonianum TaxID=479676 RepID=A0AAV6LGV2_9ERIC|nr:hypothetical protein RHGRI_006125 [Rhododendron griersonianum]